MVSSEERQCPNCGTFHLRNLSFFAYWTQCKECGTYLCPRCSGYQNPRTTQFTFLAYLLISFLFYFGIFLIIAPLTGGSIQALFSYSLAAILLIIPFFFLLLIIWYVIRRISFQNKGNIPNCPQCNGSMHIVYHDIYLYFWLFLLHTLYIATISNEIGIIFYKLTEHFVVLGIFFVILIIGITFFIIWFFKKIGHRFMADYKTNTRVWLGEIFAIFIILLINVIIIFLLKGFLPLSPALSDSIISFDMFYTITSITFWYLPTFLIGSVIYKIAQKYLLNIKKSKIIQIFIAFLFIIMPFYIWGFLSLQFNIYFQPSFFSALYEILPYYSSLFNEIIPILLVSFLLGISIISIFRKLIPKLTKNKRNSIMSGLILCIITIFTIFLVFENVYYLVSGVLFLDTVSTVLMPILIILMLSGIFILIINDLLSNWLSSKSRWGERLERNLGSLIYAVLLGFILIALSLSISVIVFLSSSATILPYFTLTTSHFILKLLFIIGFLSGLILGFKK